MERTSPAASTSSSVAVQSRTGKPSKKPKRLWLKVCKYVILTGFITALLFSIWFFLTPSGMKIRYMMADSIITTRHQQWAKYIIGEKGLKERLAKYEKKFDEMAAVPALEEVHVEPVKQEEVPKPAVQIEPISGPKWTGYLLIVNDPKKLRIVVPSKVGKGEKVSSMVTRTNAIAGVNAGGFNDPNWQGNGFQPMGVVMSGGQVFYDDTYGRPTHTVGIDKDGKMIAGKFTTKELIQMGVSEAVSFKPRFIVDGKGLIKNQADGWGIAPRTCMAQKADGTILFAIIDGRQKHSIGATLYDVQQVFLEHGAVVAANLDGGASTVLVHDNKIVNSPSSEWGERYLPTAWLVFEKTEQADIQNIWKGLDIRKIDSTKW